MQKNRFPFVLFLLSLFLASFSVASLLLARNFPSVADALNTTIGQWVRHGLAALSHGIPFSLGEVLLVLLPLFAVLLVVSALRFGRTARGRRTFVSALCLGLSLLLCSYTLTLGVGYHTTPVAQRLGYPATAVTAQSLRDVSVRLLEEAKQAAKELPVGDDGQTVTDLSLDEISERVCLGYEALVQAEPGLLSTFSSRIKGVHLSSVLSGAHLMGVYSFFTGESNINTEPPAYTIPFTVAHEFAHQRGIAREDEANFVAFLACAHSPDAFVRYSGYINLYEYTASALLKTDSTVYKSMAAAFDFPRMYADAGAYNAYYRKYADTVLGDLSETVNDTYLKLNGTEGVISYDLVVQLAVCLPESVASAP